MSDSPARRNATGNTGVNTPGSKRTGAPTRPKPVSQDAQEPPTMARCPIPDDLLSDLAVGLAEVLGGATYAVIGGIALRLLGSTRPTSDIDLFVPSSGFRVAKKFVDSSDGHFGTYNSKGRTIIWYRGLDGQKYRVYIWEAAQIRHQYPTSAAGSVTINGAHVLKPALLLDHKCKSWAEQVARGNQSRIKRDGGDIVFLLDYMGNKRLRTTNREVFHVTPEFFGDFLPFKRGSEPLFCAIGLLKTRETDTVVPTTVARGSEPRSAKRAPY